MVCLLKIHYLSDYAWLEMQILIEPTQLFLKVQTKGYMVIPPVT